MTMNKRAIAFAVLILALLCSPILARWAVTPRWRVTQGDHCVDPFGRSWEHCWTAIRPVAPLQRVWPQGVRYPFVRLPPPEPPYPRSEGGEQGTDPGKVLRFWNHDPLPPGPALPERPS